MFALEASKAYLIIRAKEPLVSGARNIYTCQFSFSGDWTGLDKTAVFQAWDTAISIPIPPDGTCQIPWEVLDKPGASLYAGVYGTQNGDLIMPTVMARLGEICQGTALGEDAKEPTPGVYEQVLAIANAAQETAQSLREDADSGAFDGAEGPPGPAPVLGVDYFTEADKQAMVQEVTESDEVQKAVSDAEQALDKAKVAEELAKGVNTARGFASYAALVDALNAADASAYKVGQSFLIITLDVPDLWVSSVVAISEPYTYVDDTTVVALLQSLGYVQAGHYRLSMLETLKQDLSNYVQFTDYATATKSGTVKVVGTGGVVVRNGVLSVDRASQGEIAAKRDSMKPVCPVYLDYAVKTGVTTNTIPLTAEEQAAAQSWLGGSMIKTIKPDADGNYSCRIWDLDAGMYLLESDTTVYHKGAAATGSLKARSGAYMMLGPLGNLGKIWMLCACLNDDLLADSTNGISVGWTTETNGGALSFTWNQLSVRNAAETYYGIKDFKVPPKISATLAADDDSTNIPTTQWVNAAIQAALTDKGL